MARPPLPIGQHGNISYRGVGTGHVRAACYVRDADGKRREVTATGKGRGEALSRLQEKLASRPGFGEDMSSETRLAEVWTLWSVTLTRRVDMGRLAPNTVRVYAGTWERHIARIGHLRLREVSVARLDAFLLAVAAENGAGIAKTCRSVLSGLIGFAVRRGALTRNPVRDVSPIAGGRGSGKQARAMTATETAHWLALMDADEVAVYHDVPDLTRMMLATGLRMGECLALLLDEMREPIREKLLRVDFQIDRVVGVGLVRRPTKSAAGERTLRLPAWGVDLVVRRGEARGWRGPLFPGVRSGGWRDPSNTAADLRAARERTPFAWVTSHVFRKTVATVLDEAGLTARVVADQLGHSKVSMTQDHYMGRRAVHPAAAAALDGLLGAAGVVSSLGERDHRHQVSP